MYLAVLVRTCQGMPPNVSNKKLSMYIGRSEVATGWIHVDVALMPMSWTASWVIAKGTLIHWENITYCTIIIFHNSWLCKLPEGESNNLYHLQTNCLVLYCLKGNTYSVCYWVYLSGIYSTADNGASVSVCGIHISYVIRKKSHANYILCNMSAVFQQQCSI